MKGLPKFIGRGLLVVALSSCAFACGDDDGGKVKPTPDGGGEAGSGEAGSGSEPDGGGTAGSGDVDSGAPSVDECVTAATTATSGMVADACLMCACENGAAETVACDATCWSLIGCFQANCSDLADPTDMTMRTNCAVANCADSIGGATAATPLGAILTASCATECASAPVGGDGGTDSDAGN